MIRVSRYILGMFTLRDHHSGDLFDPWEYLGPKRRRLLDQIWAGVFRDYLLKQLPVGELATEFRDDFGRPTKDLYVALGALILQQLHDLTDQQTTEVIALNIAWHYALDIRQESDAYLCERTLRNYRKKVLDAGLDQVLFRTLTDKLIEEIGVDTGQRGVKPQELLADSHYGSTECIEKGRDRDVEIVSPAQTPKGNL